VVQIPTSLGYRGNCLVWALLFFPPVVEKDRPFQIMLLRLILDKFKPSIFVFADPSIPQPSFLPINFSSASTIAPIFLNPGRRSWTFNIFRASLQSFCALDIWRSVGKSPFFQVFSRRSAVASDSRCPFRGRGTPTNALLGQSGINLSFLTDRKPLSYFLTAPQRALNLPRTHGRSRVFLLQTSQRKWGSWVRFR